MHRMPRPLLTKAENLNDVSRGTPKPHSLTGDALVQARLREVYRVILPDSVELP
jgi:hypothetical protein